MPFTFAHPAIVLPLKDSKRFSFTALVAGSIVPDFEFFFQMREVENIGHHWYGIALFDFPVALLFCFLFHNLLRNLLVANLPPSLNRRFGNIADFNWNLYAAAHKFKVAYSLFAGIASHILWDGFTHYDGFFVALIPALSANSGMANLPVYFLLQVLFSILGMGVLAAGVFRMPMPFGTEIRAGKNRLYWPLFSLVLTAILIIRLGLWPEYNSFWGVFMAAMGAICYTWLLVSLVFNFYPPQKKSL